MKKSRSRRAPAARAVKGAQAAPFPGFIAPCNPTLRANVPVGVRWRYEIKLDGYRAQLHWHNRAARAFSRNGLDYGREFASVCAAAAELPARSAVIDGEVVAPGKDGIPDFGALRAAMSSGQDKLLFYAFDLLYLDGLDLRRAQLADRRRALEELIAGKPGGRILLSETLDEPGPALFDHACEMGLEGIVAKLADSPYRSGRSDAWVKIKCVKTLRLPVIGFVPARGGSIAALRLARREGRDLVYVGKAGSGFSARSGPSVRARLEPLMRRTAPVAKPLRKKDTIWVEPRLEAIIEARGITDDGMLRHPSFKRLA